MKINKRRPAFEYNLVSDSKDLFVSIFEKTPVGIVLFSSLKPESIQINQAALKLFNEKSVQSFCDHFPKLLNQFNNKSLGKRDYLQKEIKVKKYKGGLVYLTAKARKLDKSQVILTLEDVTQYKKEQRKLLKMAQIDGLTGLLNHKTLIQRFKEELVRAKKYHLPLSCFMFDVDDFKGFNDRFGHLQGNALLKKTAKLLKSQMRETDIVGRSGGDEFLVILPETPLSEVWIPAKRLHSYFIENPFIFKGKNVDFVNTFSIGISGFPIKGLDTVKDIINHADKGLYASKLKGGNQIILYKA